MNLNLPEEFVLFDLEYTAWEGSDTRDWTGPDEYREVIQIGAIQVHGIEETSSFCEFVRPEKNPQLSEYIIALTGITQKDVDEKGLSFPDAVKLFLTFVGDTQSYCFGRDTEVLEENGGFHGNPLALSREQFHDLRSMSAATWLKAGIDINEYSSGTLIEAFTKAPGRRAHDALNDMRNLLDAIKELQKL